MIIVIQKLAKQIFLIFLLSYTHSSFAQAPDTTMNSHHVMSEIDKLTHLLSEYKKHHQQVNLAYEGQNLITSLETVLENMALTMDIGVDGSTAIQESISPFKYLRFLLRIGQLRQIQNRSHKLEEVLSHQELILDQILEELANRSEVENWQDEKELLLTMKEIVEEQITKNYKTKEKLQADLKVIATFVGVTGIEAVLLTGQALTGKLGSIVQFIPLLDMIYGAAGSYSASKDLMDKFEDEEALIEELIMLKKYAADESNDFILKVIALRQERIIKKLDKTKWQKLIHSLRLGHYASEFGAGASGMALLVASGETAAILTTAVAITATSGALLAVGFITAGGIYVYQYKGHVVENRWSHFTTWTKQKFLGIKQGMNHKWNSYCIKKFDQNELIVAQDLKFFNQKLKKFQSSELRYQHHLAKLKNNNQKRQERLEKYQRHHERYHYYLEKKLELTHSLANVKTVDMSQHLSRFRQRQILLNHKQNQILQYLAQADLEFVEKKQAVKFSNYNSDQWNQEQKQLKNELDHIENRLELKKFFKKIGLNKKQIIHKKHAYSILMNYLSKGPLKEI